MDIKIKTITKKDGTPGKKITVSLPYTITINKALSILDEASLINDALAVERAEVTPLIKKLLVKGCSVEQIEKMLAEWKPGFELPKKKVDPTQKIVTRHVTMYNKLDPEVKAAVLKELGLTD
jgi:hypothetical protein